jgi:hypothetical protein
MGHRQSIQCSVESIPMQDVDRGHLSSDSAAVKNTVVSNSATMGSIVFDQFFTGEEAKEVQSIIDRDVNDRLVQFDAMFHKVRPMIHLLRVTSD